jgi:hypothetical protein
MSATQMTAYVDEVVDAVAAGQAMQAHLHYVARSFRL